MADQVRLSSANIVSEPNATPSDKGRYVKAASNLATGEEILRTGPYVHIVCQEYLTNLCANCLHYLNYARHPALVRTSSPVGNEGDATAELSELEEQAATLGAFAALTAEDEDVVMSDPSPAVATLPTAKSFSCEHCNLAHYCSAECKRMHWEAIHQSECPYWAKAIATSQNSLTATNYTRTCIRLVIRMMCLRAQEETRPADPNARGPRKCAFTDLFLLVGHSENSLEHIDSYEYVKACLPPALLPFSSLQITRLLGAIDSNQFGIWGMDNELMGVAVHPVASFFNHSCLPNAFRKCSNDPVDTAGDISRDSSYTGVYLVFRTLCPVQAGEELNIAYIKITDKLKPRQKQLQSHYHFQCSCPRCSAFTDNYPRVTYEKYFHWFLSCPKDGGIMCPVRRISNEMEQRECNYCAFTRASQTVPSITSFCQEWKK